ncbi:MAG TPA: diguanylate cyclase [Fimbriimonadaceae bacterium]|nr:diguanylate cyclase [Fimbriimonadaceae bacterium]
MGTDNRNEILVSNPNELIRTLAANGIAASLNASDNLPGYLVPLELAEGQTLFLGVPGLDPLSPISADQAGLAALDATGRVEEVWGLAKKFPFLAVGENVLSGPLNNLISKALSGSPATMLHSGARFFASSGTLGSKNRIVLLVTSAEEEEAIQERAAHSERLSQVLASLGTTLTMSQTVANLCVAAAHEINSSAELAAVLIWIPEDDGFWLRLCAHVGVNRAGIQALERIASTGGSSCVAELVAGSRQPFHHDDVATHMLTSGLESKICYLKPGGTSVHPLVSGDRTLGVLQLIGREGDRFFANNQNLFRTIAEHLSLALNNAMLFESVERLAAHDPLTGIANHRTMQEFLHQRLAESNRANQPLGLLMIDVDHFRAFNEEEGHELGDSALKYVADVLSNCVRPYDLAARYGGEEFTVILPGSNQEATLIAAERIRASIEDIVLRTPTGRTRHVTASIGCAVYPTAAQDPTTLLRAADAALYEAKRSGRNKVVAFEGLLTGHPKTEKRDVDTYLDWVPEDRREFALNTLTAVESPLNELAKVFSLSTTQLEISRAAIFLSDTFLTADHFCLARLESAPELRTVLPTLYGLKERFDGTGARGMKGARIPLLSRIVTALLGQATDRGDCFTADPGRFDPQIVALLGELDEAA